MGRLFAGGRNGLRMQGPRNLPVRNHLNPIHLGRRKQRPQHKLKGRMNEGQNVESAMYPSVWCRVNKIGTKIDQSPFWGDVSRNGAYGLCGKSKHEHSIFDHFSDMNICLFYMDIFYYCSRSGGEFRSVYRADSPKSSKHFKVSVSCARSEGEELLIQYDPVDRPHKPKWTNVVRLDDHCRTDHCRSCAAVKVGGAWRKTIDIQSAGLIARSVELCTFCLADLKRTQRQQGVSILSVSPGQVKPTASLSP